MKNDINKLYVKTCIVCDKVFKTPNKDADKCTTCIKNRTISAAQANRASKHTSANKSIDIDDIDFIINQYYKAHKTVLSYGKVKSMIYVRPTSCVVCGTKLVSGHICSDCMKL